MIDPLEDLLCHVRPLAYPSTTTVLVRSFLLGKKGA